MTPGALRPPLPVAGPTVLAVGLQWPDPADADQFHLGLFLEHLEAGLLFVGVGWHLNFHVIPLERLTPPADAGGPNRQAWWHPVGLHPAKAEHLEDKLGSHIERFGARASQDAAEGVPYGFLPPTGRQFDAQQGHWLDAPPGAGLTCATYVMAVFRDFAGVALLDPDTWQQRPQDAVWQGRVLAALRQSPGVAPEHLARLRGLVGCFRFRPAEVAFAAATPEGALPLTFAPAEAGGRAWESQVLAEAGQP